MSFLLNPYVKRFSLVYVIAVIAIMVIGAFINLGGAANVVSLLVANTSQRP